MSNLEKNPPEVICRDHTAQGEPAVVLTARDVPLGGPRAMTVRRSLPQRQRSLIGAWCFVDHYGPDDVADSGGMAVPGHPHTGLQTVSWLFSGEVEHRDTTGAHAFVRPGQLNIMTAGSGIAHSEYSTAATRILHGVQLWVALPDRDRFVAPSFEHYEPPVLTVGGGTALVFLGRLLGHQSPVPTHTPLVGAELNLPAGARLDLDVDPRHEHGFLCDTGTVLAEDATAKPGELLFLPSGRSRLTIEASPSEPTRLVLIGGEPLGEQIVMWWNFIGRSHEEVAGFREEWQAARETAGQGRFAAFPTEWERTLPAPALPNARLRSRG
jgi:redox-sensitive bicupin YhaK (pirin superfamily)